MVRVLVIGAPPDDEVLGSGGVIARHADAGDEVYVCILSEGASAQYADPEMIKVRRAAARKAAKILGVKDSFYHDLPDSRMETVPHVEINAILEKHVAEVKPEVVYTHFGGDTDLDHQRSYRSTIVAARPKVDSPIRKVLCYEVLGQTHWAGPGAESAFNPNVFIDIGDYLGKKLAAMKCYSSEVEPYPHPRSLTAIDALAKIRGVLCGCEAAEAFVLVRDVQRA